MTNFLSIIVYKYLGVKSTISYFLFKKITASHPSNICERKNLHSNIFSLFNGVEQTCSKNFHHLEMKVRARLVEKAVLEPIKYLL